MDFVLASASPRRRELLEALGIKELRIIPPQGEERVEPGLAPGETVCRLSRQKALEVADGVEGDALVIGADTVVVLEGRILGKPRDREDAVNMLTELSGREHAVYTGFTVLRGDRIISRYETTAVRFRRMSRREIEAYVATGEPMDKAGAYGAQGLGALFVEGIEGDFFNVMGLPLCALSLALRELEVELL